MSVCVWWQLDPRSQASQTDCRIQSTDKVGETKRKDPRLDSKKQTNNKYL